MFDQVPNLEWKKKNASQPVSDIFNFHFLHC